MSYCVRLRVPGVVKKDRLAQEINRALMTPEDYAEFKESLPYVWVENGMFVCDAYDQGPVKDELEKRQIQFTEQQ